VIASTILFGLILAAPLGAAVDAENPRPPAAEPPEETNGSFPARPQGPPAPDPSLPDRVRHTAIYYLNGFATPVGVVGLEGVERVGRWFELTGGLGMGFGAAGSEPHTGLGHALQWAAMPRLRLGDDHGGFTIGAGISGGNYADFPIFCGENPCTTNPYPVSYFLWSNFEIGGEHWWSGGFAMRYFIGYAHAWCVSNPCVSALTNLPYFGYGIGYAF